MLQGLSFPGTFQDALGFQEITWTVDPYLSRRPGFQISTHIRGLTFRGDDFELMEPDDLELAAAAGFELDLDCVTECVLTGEIPCRIAHSGRLIDVCVEFELDTRRPIQPDHLHLTLSLNGSVLRARSGWFEDAMLDLGRQLPYGYRWHACIGCLFSDYHPAGHGMLGMLCHRGSKQQYLAVRTKSDYFRVPITEDVMETYVCDEFEVRVPGTGYRG